jgi:hypothetical protein
MAGNPIATVALDKDAGEQAHDQSGVFFVAYVIVWLRV